LEEAKNCDEEQEKMLSEKLQKEKLETECEKQPAKDVQRTQKDEAILTPNSREGNVDSPQTPAIAKTNFSVRVRYLLIPLPFVLKLLWVNFVKPLKATAKVG
jgi:hypothetical protein